MAAIWIGRLGARPLAEPKKEVDVGMRTPKPSMESLMHFRSRAFPMSLPVVVAFGATTIFVNAGCSSGGGGAGGKASTSASTTGSSATSTSATSSTSTGMTVPRAPVTVTGTTDTRFVTADHLFASVEMQLSGEPLAEAMGRDLSGYSRDFPTPNVYFDANGNPSIDLPGFSTAVESYEYSKQPMNNLAFESGAGTSLLFGPIMNPGNATGTAALAILLPRIQHFAEGSNASPTFVSAVDGTDPKNRLGWPGFWPTVHPYRSFDPTINAVNTVDETCSISSDDDPNATGNILNLDYECDYNSLHLPNRSTQIEPVITPGADGWSGWKYGLWVLNYLQSMHDVQQTAIDTVPAGQLSGVGAPDNMIIGSITAGGTGVAGTYLGSSDIEGFQAQVMIDELDNAAEDWLKKLTTSDGTTLSGFSSIESALQYNYATPLRWFPGAISVTETADPSGYPQPSGFAINDSGSHLCDLLGLAGSYATIYSLTDQANQDVGGSQPAMAYFDGDPFPHDNQVADGENTLHDHALAVLRVLIVNIDRLHRDAASGLLVDDVAFTGATPKQGTTIATSSVAYSIVALRTVRRSLTSKLELYSNTTPDLASSGAITVLDGPGLPLTGAPGGATVISDRLTALIDSESQLLLDKLTTADGHALAGWDVSTNAASSTDDSLDAHAAAIRGLLAAYLSTGDTSYRDRAVAVFNRMDKDFYDPAGLIYVGKPGDKSIAYTPKRFAILEAALRDMYELVGLQPGQDALGKVLQDRLARLIKLVLNGWDDLNGDGLIQYDSECITAVPYAGGSGIGLDKLGHGGLQMAERALSGELGSVCDSIDPNQCIAAGLSPVRQYTPDREHDCVPEISAVNLPSALANQVTFQIGK